MNNSLTSLIVIAVLVLLVLLIWSWVRQRSSTPESTELKPDHQYDPADFDPGNITPIDLNGLPVFLGKGSFTNKLGQTLLINVMGSSDRSVIEYFKMAKFHLELKEPIDDLDTDEEPQQKEPDLSIRKILKDQEGSVRVNFDLSRDTLQKHRKGSIFVKVDPTVQSNKYNNYSWRNPDNNRATVWVKVREGKVIAKMYRDCEKISGPKSIGAGPQKKLSGRGEGNFDLTVEGDTAGTNNYELTGAWNYSFEDAVASQGSEDVPCP